MRRCSQAASGAARTLDAGRAVVPQRCWPLSLGCAVGRRVGSALIRRASQSILSCPVLHSKLRACCFIAASKAIDKMRLRRMAAVAACGAASSSLLSRISEHNFLVLESLFGQRERLFKVLEWHQLRDGLELLLTNQIHQLFDHHATLDFTVRLCPA